MTDQQRLRDALHAAVPDPPEDPGRGSVARGRARAGRRVRRSVAGAAVVVVAVAGVGILTERQHDSGQTASATGVVACRHLVRAEHAGNYVDSRVVDGPTAAAWLSSIRTEVDPAPYRDDDRVTVCLTFRLRSYATYVVGHSGREERVTTGSYVGQGGAQQVMQNLDRRVTGGRATTDGPFSCSGSRTERFPDVAISLPEGATAARICYRGGYFTPPQVLTHGVDSLVRAVNAAPISYVAPNVNCSGAGAPEFTLVFRYPSGTRSVAEETCRGLALGQYTRASRTDLEQEFMSLLLQQVGVPPGSVLAPPCPTSTTDRPAGVGDLRNVVTARYCPTTSASSGRMLTLEQLAQLRQWGHSLEFAASTEPENTCSRPTTGWPRLALADAWGNRFTVVLVGCGLRMFPAAVNWGATHKVTYPLGNFQIVARLAQELAAAAAGR